jgi:hypothetical protein
MTVVYVLVTSFVNDLYYPDVEVFSTEEKAEAVLKERMDCLPHDMYGWRVDAVEIDESDE